MRAARNFLDGAQVQQVLANLLFTELVGPGMMELGELSDGADVGLEGAVGIAAELEVLHHAVVERGHAEASFGYQHPGQVISSIPNVLRRSLIMRSYTAVVERDTETGLLVGLIPGFRGAHSQGKHGGTRDQPG